MPQTPDRSLLLPPYLQTEVWESFVESIDAVLKDRIDDPTVWLSKQRDTWIIKDTSEAKIQAGELLADTDFELPEKELLVHQANLLGFDFKEAELLSANDYQRLVRNLALFWYGKGKPNFMNFMGFVINSVITITNLWSTEGTQPGTYGEFLPEGDPGIGTPVWDGGTWFPTTHVRVAFDPFKFGSVSTSRLVALFYSIANYNLVLDRIDLDGFVFIHPVNDPEIANVVHAYPLIEITTVIETL